MLLIQTDPVFADSEAHSSTARIYRSPEERRDAGLGRSLTEWLTVSGLLEIERESDKFKPFENQLERNSGSTVYNSQIALEILFSETIKSEINVEIEHDLETHSYLDEAFLVFDFGEIEIEMGRLSLPFGEYYSHFTTGPILEIGETLSEGVVAGYSFSDQVEVSAFAFKSKSNPIQSKQANDWGINLEYQSGSENLKLGVGYTSDLSESDEQLLDDYDNRYDKKVGAWNAYALFGFEHFEITAEYLSASSRFRELDSEYDRPSARNIELAYYITLASQLSFRFEQSDDIEEAPSTQYGVNLTWRPNQYTLFSLEYLRGKFKKGLLVSDNEYEIRDRNIVAAQIAIEF